MPQKCRKVPKVRTSGEAEVVEGATLIGEKDLTLDDEVDILWHLILAVYDGFESADIH
jgi:hypothetical protein